MARSARARGLGAELRAARLKTGLEAQEVGKRLGWSKSTMSRVENGMRRVNETDVSAVLAVLGVTGDEREKLLSLARELDQPVWWETGSTTGLPTQLTALLGFERDAHRITELSITLVPGLLQTHDYARALMLGGGVSESDVDARVAIRRGRQDIITRRNPVQFVAIIDQGALLRPVGDSTVMADQLQQLIKAAALPNVEIRMLPFGVHPGIDGSFSLFEFPKAPSIVHLEHHRSSGFLDEPEDVSAYVTLRDNVLSTALSVDESVELLSQSADEWESRADETRRDQQVADE
ncbi:MULTISPECIES: helix-turn-helix domain-containing protein [Saccharopolyspora]|uniref:helix-turn-helix domain-containing protein n=1 Tax=Saccharopolyspora TaxID=1835 RepID=UPI0033C68BCC